MTTASRRPPRSLFRRWGAFVARHPWYIVGLWLVSLATTVGLVVAIGGTYADEFSLPGSESQEAFDLLEERFPSQGGDTAQLVFQADAGVDDPAVRARIESVLAQARGIPAVSEVSSPYEQQNAISDDGRTAFANVQFPETDIDAVESLVEIVESAGGDGLVVEAGGMAVQQTEQEPPGESELIGITAAAIILIIAFGSIVAMGVPIITALFALGGAMTLLTLLTRVLDLSSFTPAFAAMIGLGVGIDYALLVVTRYREGVHKGLSVRDAVATAVDTAGRSVLFAGTVVIIALASLTLVGIPFVAGLGIATAIVVGLSVIAGLSLLPAVLAIVGTRIDALAIPFLRSTEDQHHATIWYRLSQAIQRRPLIFIGLGAGTLAVLAIPFFSMQTNFTDAGNGSEDMHSRRAYDLLSEGFGPGFNGPLTVVVDLSEGGGDAIEGLRTSLAAHPNVDDVGRSRINEAQDTAIIPVYPRTSPQDVETNELVHDIRDTIIPAAERSAPIEGYVTGSTAVTIDLSDQIRAQTPIFFTFVIGLSFVVLMVVFRSVLIPLTAAAMNLLSIGAAYGVLVAVFQWGWFAGPLGIDVTGPIETFLPMMMFAILFGLSMDYEVFLVSRIHEEHLEGARNSHAVSIGLASTARVITSAALIMIAVFGSFVLGDERVIKEFGLGLAVAIFIDATVVRLLLVPAIMEMLGEANWWLPGPLARILPRIDVEGGHDLESAQVLAGGGD